MQLKKEIDVASRRRIDTEKSVTDTQSRVNIWSYRSNI